MTNEEQLKRILRVAGGDEGLYVLALHSFIESYARRAINMEFYRDPSFQEWLDLFAEKRIGGTSVARDAQSAIVRLQKEHTLTNKVRHRFTALSPEEAAAATHNFLVFCSVAGIESEVLARLQEALGLWKQRKAPVEYAREVQSLRFRLELAGREREKLMARSEELDSVQSAFESAEAERRQLLIENQRLSSTAEAKKGRVDELRRKLHDSDEKLKHLSQQLTEFDGTVDLIEYLERITIYTRTRSDFERSLMELTPEQRGALDLVDGSHPIMIKGSAGTGKSIVLLHAFQRELEARAAQPTLDKIQPAVYLTYTKTLVRFSEYLAGLMRTHGAAGQIATVHSYLLGKLKRLIPRARVEYDLALQMATELNATSFFTDEELVAEIEGLIFANLLTRDEYVDQRVKRRDMSQPLSQGQRTQVWMIRDLMVERMEETKVYTKNYARQAMAQILSRDESARRELGADRVFVDETQDLDAADLYNLNDLSMRGLVMASDDGQCIYNVGSPFRRVGIDIVGRTRILRTNFRNSRPILEFAEEFRNSTIVDADYADTMAFREGPLPELLTAESDEGLVEMIVDRVRLFCQRLAYDPENIAVIAPTGRVLEAVRDALQRAGLTAQDVREDDFDFDAPGRIRLTTLHSSKGIDFPVVLLYIPKLRGADSICERAADKLQRNLIYVALTRAMDHLMVFLRSDTAEPALVKLADAHRNVMDRWRAQSGSSDTVE